MLRTHTTPHPHNNTIAGQGLSCLSILRSLRIPGQPYTRLDGGRAGPLAIFDCARTDLFLPAIVRPPQRLPGL